MRNTICFNFFEAFCPSISFVLDIGLLPQVVVDVLAVGLHLLDLLVHELLIVIALLLALVDGSQLMAKLLHDLLEPLGQVVDRPSHELSIDDLLLIELTPFGVTDISIAIRITNAISIAILRR